MAITDTQKVDYLWKKLGYGRAKTDINSIKNATNESISSPLFLRGDQVWSQATLIPNIIPTNNEGVVTVYSTSNPVECTVDITSSTNRTWKTGITDWIPPEIGSSYLIKVYLYTPGQSANAAINGTQIFGAGSGNNDEWFFDYQSGTLNFIGTNLPSGISGKSVYISGAVYTGIKGVAVPGAGASFSFLDVTGISTFNGKIDVNGGAEINNIQIGVSSDNQIDTLVGNLILDSFSGQTLINDDVIISDNLRISGISTFSSNIDVNGHAEIKNIRIGVSSDNEIDTSSGDLILDSASGHTLIDDSLTISNNLKVSGISTFVGSVTFEGGTINLGDSDSDNINVSGQFVSNLVANTDNLYDIGITTQRWRNAQFAGIITASYFDGNLNELGNTYYVATTGNDSNSGNNINNPFLTLEQALSVATNGDIINVSAGVFQETCPLTIPRGVTVKGSGLRSTTITPTNATKQENIFLLNDVSTVEDMTIRGSYYDSLNDTGYAFSYAPGIAITTRSPYIQRVTVLNFGSNITSEDPFGYDTADSPPTSYIAGRGAKVDGSLVSSNSLEAGMLFNEVTFFTPNNKGIVATNGARIEYLNCFNYFASQSVIGIAGTEGIAGNANAKLKFNNLSVTPSVDDVIKLYDNNSVVAVGTITSYDSGYARIDGKGYGTFTSVGIGTTQDVRIFQSDGTTQIGTAGAILLADYKMFGAEMRSIGCAFQYGDQGVVADGVGVELRLFSINFNHIGSGKDFSNDPTIAIQSNEITELNGGKISFVSVDQDSNFRVGNSFVINQDTGAVSFASTSYSLDVTGDIDVTDGTNTSNLSPTSLTVGTLRIAADTLLSTSGDINISPAGSSETNIDGNLNVSGILTASVLQVSSIQKGDTSIAIYDVGSDSSIEVYIDASQKIVVNNTQFAINNDLSVSGVSTFASFIDANNGIDITNGLSVSGVSTFASFIDANNGIDITNGLSVSGIATFNSLVDANNGIDITNGLSVSGVSTFVSFIDANNGVDISNGLSVSGVSTFASFIDANNGVDISNGLSVSGVSTFASFINANNGVDITNGLSVSGVGTFNSLLDANAAAHINDLRLGVSANNEIDTSAGNLVLDSASGMTYIDDDLTIAGNLFINGSTTQVNTTEITVEDRVIELGRVDGNVPTSPTTWDLGVLFNYHDGSAKKSAVVWENSTGRFTFASNVSESVGVGSTSPQVTYTTFAPIEISSLWVNDCAGQSQVISCTGTERFLNNITIDGGSF